MKNPLKKEYLKDFKKTAQGEYVYTGGLYRLEGDRKRAKLIVFLLCLASIIPVVASGFTTAGGMKNSFYVILPYALEISAGFGFAWNAVRFLASGERIREYIFSSFSTYLPIFSGALAVISLLSVCGITAFLIINGGEGKTLQCALLIGAKLISASCAFASNKFFRSLSFAELSESGSEAD